MTYGCRVITLRSGKCFEQCTRSRCSSECTVDVLTMRVTAALATLNNVEIEVSTSPREASSYSPRTRTKSVTRISNFSEGAFGVDSG